MLCAEVMAWKSARESASLSSPWEVPGHILRRQHRLSCRSTGPARVRAEATMAFLAYLVQSQCQTDGYGCFTDTRLCRSNCRHQYQITLLHLLFINQMSRESWLCIVHSSLPRHAGYADTFGNLLYLLQLYAAGYFNVRFHTESFL